MAYKDIRINKVIKDIHVVFKNSLNCFRNKLIALIFQTLFSFVSLCTFVS